MGFVGALGLLTPILGPSQSAVAADQAAIPLSQALDQLESAVTGLEGAIPTGTTPARSDEAKSQPTQTRSPQRIIDDARTLYDRKLFAAASSLILEQRSLQPALADLPDALRLLADALTEQGDLRGAKAQLVALVSKKPSDGEALAKLVALSTQLGPDPQEKTWLSQLTALPPSSQPESAVYLRGKLLFLRGDAQGAIDALSAVPDSSAYFYRAHYVVGAAQVQVGKLDGALSTFTALADRPLPRRDDDLRIVELCNMALGRIFHERGDSKKAHDFYLRISQKSSLFKDAIYEASWSALKAGDSERAEQSLKLLLLAYRDEPSTALPVAEAKLFLGNLLLRRGEPDAAAEYFSNTRAELTPLVEKLQLDLGSAPTFTDRLRGQLGSVKAPLSLQTLAHPSLIASLRGDEVLTQLQATDRELYSTRIALEEQEQALRQAARRPEPSGASSVGAADLSEPRNRSLALYRYLVALHRASGDRLDALFASVATAEEKQQLQSLSQRREAVSKSLAEPKGGNDPLDGTSLARRSHAELLGEEGPLYLHLLLRLPTGSRAQADEMLQALGRATTIERRLRDAIGKLDRLLDVRVGNMQSQLASERDSLRQQQEALEKLSSDTAQIVGQAAWAKLSQTADQYRELLISAEAGIAEVAWARRQKSSDELAQIQHDQQRELRMLDDAFALPEDNKPAAKPPSQPLVSAMTEQAPQTKPEEVPLPSELPPELAADYRRYFEAARSYKQVLDEVGREGYKQRRNSLKSDFADRLTREEANEKKLRAEAIVELERFLGRHPQHPRHSPEAMFRLAELLFERTNEAFIGQSKSQTGELVALPEYGPSVELYRRLLRDFPSYRNNHLATYLLGYCLGEMDHDDEARQAFLGLVCANKYQPLATPAPPVGRKNKPPYDGCEALPSDPKLRAETWTRLGEHHFDRGELDAAIFAYQQAVPFREPPYFDKALYKLAWSFYRSDRFVDAVKHFDELVVLADQKKLGEPGKKEGFALRTESVQYLALSFAERDWDGDGKDDPVSGLSRAELHYKGRESEPHVREVFQRMGDVLFDRTEYARAAEVYKRAIAMWPLAAENPRIQDRVVQAMERLRNFEQALREREQLARTYVEGSDWAKQNHDNDAALTEGLKLADAALMNVVLRRHESAQKLREQAQAKSDPKLREQAIEEYRQAAASYEAYLKQHPNSKDRYEYSYYLAESLFFGEKYPDAAEAYEKVRDADPKGKYVEDSAYGAIKAREAVVSALYREQVAQKLGGEPPLPQTGKLTPPVTPIALPDDVAKLQVAYDRYVTLLPDSTKIALFSYKAAEIDFRYLRFSQMRLRMADIVHKHCKDEHAVDAGNALLVSYNIEGDLEKLEEWTAKLKERGCGGGSQVAQSQQGTIKKLSQQVRFKKAEQLLAQKRFAEAASLFIELVGQDPRGNDADKALFNAAVAQESDRRYGAATETYERIVSEYPQSTLVDEALFRAAVNHQRFFEYDKAVTAYQKLGTEPRFKSSTHRHDALYNAALIAENDQRYSLAADLWKQYAQSDKTSPDEAATAQFRAALSIEKLGSSARAEQELSQFVGRYAQTPSAAPQVVEAYVRLGKLEQKQGNPFDATENYKRAAQLGQKLPPGSDAAEYAAEAAFLLAEQKLQEVERLKIGGSGKELEGSISAFNKKVQETVVVYDKVLTYRRANQTLAAYFRMGYVFELYAKAFLAAPCPPEVRRLGAEACDLYKNKIEENVAGIEEKALQRYAVTLEQAQKLGVSNQWTKLARQRANAYKPDTYPLTKDEHVAKQLILPGPVVTQDSSELGKLAKEARAAMYAGQYENAIVLGKLALAKDDHHVSSMLVLATSYYFLGKRELSAAIVGISQTIDANNAEGYVLLGFLALAKDDRIAATAAFKKATELDPASGLAWHNLSAMYLLAKNYEQALFACERSTVLLPGLLTTQLNLGSALRGMRRFIEADTAYKKVVSAEPQNADALYNLGILYLDAPSMPGFDPVSQRMIAIRYLESYQDATRGTRDDSAEAYIKDARSAIEREQRRQKKKPTPTSAEGSQ